MTGYDPNSLEAPVFTARITPHRSLSRRGLAVLMAFVGLVGIGVSVPFWLMGAWPIAGFMGLDVALIYAAFRYNNRAARAYEEIVLTRISLLFRAVSWRGEARDLTFNPAWTRLEREDHPELGLERLALVQGRVRAEVAACLGREERAEFADAFQSALREARR